MQELFKRAAEIAAVVPESMQEAAFHRALDALTRTTEHVPIKKTAARHTAKTSSLRGREEDARSGEADRVAQVTAISKDDAPEVDRESAVLGRSIALLVVADREAGVDGMTAPEIAKVLTEKFRHRTSRQSVQSALDAAGNMVDRHKPGSSAALYRVMKPGEEWLAKTDEERGRSAGSRRSGGAKKAAPSKAPAKKAVPAEKSNSSRKPASPNRSRTGPKGALEALISEGFFAEPRGIADIRKELRDQKALSYASTDLSPGLTRLLREGRLKRNRAEKQYVYTSG